MDLTRLTTKERLLLLTAVRLHLHVFYGLKDGFGNEEMLAEMLIKVFKGTRNRNDGEIDEMLDISLELFEKISHTLLDELNEEN